MKIKQPDSDVALEKLWEITDQAKDRLRNCITKGHTTLSLLYISSLIVTDRVVFNGRRFLDQVSAIVNYSPQNVICAIRTMAPSHFGFSTSMRRLQDQAINFLKKNCYVSLYSKRGEFLNHAKFLLYYQVCFSERIIYHGKYYGSTNLTMVGLGRCGRRPGNYEEFYARWERPKYELSRSDGNYIREVLELITHKAHLYTDPLYLKEFLSTHVVRLKEILNHGERILSGTTLSELYETFVDLQLAYNQTCALLEDAPGKKITSDLLEELLSLKLPISPFELEATVTDISFIDLLSHDPDFDEGKLRALIKEDLDVVRKAFNLIEERYARYADEVKYYLDDNEIAFLEFLKKNNKAHVEKLKKAIKLAESHKWELTD